MTKTIRDLSYAQHHATWCLTPVFYHAISLCHIRKRKIKNIWERKQEVRLAQTLRASVVLVSIARLFHHVELFNTGVI